MKNCFSVFFFVLLCCSIFAGEPNGGLPKPLFALRNVDGGLVVGFHSLMDSRREIPAERKLYLLIPPEKERIEVQSFDSFITESRTGGLNLITEFMVGSKASAKIPSESLILCELHWGSFVSTNSIKIKDLRSR